MAIRFNPVGEINLHGKILALSQSVRKMNFSSRKLKECQLDRINWTTDFADNADEGEGSRKFQVDSREYQVERSLAPCRMNLSGLMALSYVFSFGVNSIFQGSCNPQSLRQSEVDVLFNIPLIGLFKAVRFESYSFHVAILLWKIAVSSTRSLVPGR